MNTSTCIILMVMLMLISMGVGINVGDMTATDRIHKDAVKNDVGFYSANRETGKVKFYWISNGTNVEAYVEGK